MDFSVHAGDEDSSFVFMSSDGHFSSQALRGNPGLRGGTTMHSLPPPKSEWEAIGRETMKKRIREEILAKEMAERRILEEEVRREIEMERIMEIKRLKMESGLTGSSGIVIPCDRLTRTFLPSLPEASGVASAGRNFVQDAVEFAFRERSSSRLLQNKTLNAVAQSSLQQKPDKSSTSKETTPTNFKLSGGAKRKASAEFLLPAEKKWVCTLCDLNATSEKALKDHLLGRKHRFALSLEGTCATLKKKHPEGNTQQKLEEGASATGPPLLKKHTLGKNQNKIWCSICKVRCNSQYVMECHLAGKKHKAFVAWKEPNDSCQTETVKKGSDEIEGIVNEEEVATAQCSSIKEA